MFTERILGVECHFMIWKNKIERIRTVSPLFRPYDLKFFSAKGEASREFV